MKNIAYFLKTFVVVVVVIFLGLMAFFNRGFLWDQTRIARAFYFVWQGDESIKANNFQAAIDNYKTALRVYPEHPKAHYNLGNIYFWYEVYTASPEKKPIKTYKYDKEQKKFVLHIEPPAEDGDTENSAEAAYIKATEVYPDYINAWINLGLVREKKYDLEGAVEAFMKGVNADPMIVNIPFIFNNEESIKFNRAVAYYDLGHIYNQLAQSSDYDNIREGYHLNAMDYYLKSYKINPKSYKTNYNLAHTYQLLERTSPSIDHYCQAIKLDPFKYEAHYNLGVLLKNQERFIASAEEIKKAAMMIDFGSETKKADYIFRILTDVSFRAAAMGLLQRRLIAERYYPIPKTGIIADVIGAPIIEEQQKLKLEEREKKLEEEKEEEEKAKKQGKTKEFLLDQTAKELSSCVTDPGYSEKIRKKYEEQPDWIFVDKVLLGPPVQNKEYFEELQGSNL